MSLADTVAQIHRQLYTQVRWHGDIFDYGLRRIEQSLFDQRPDRLRFGRFAHQGHNLADIDDVIVDGYLNDHPQSADDFHGRGCHRGLNVFQQNAISHACTTRLHPQFQGCTKQYSVLVKDLKPAELNLT